MENCLQTLVLGDYEIVFLVDYASRQYRKVVERPGLAFRYPESGTLGDRACLHYLKSVHSEDRRKLLRLAYPPLSGTAGEEKKKTVVSYRHPGSDGTALYRAMTIVPYPGGTAHICAVRDTTEETRQRLESSRELRLKDEGIRFIVENMCENFLIVNIRTHECTTFTHRHGSIVCKNDYNNQIGWFAENLVVPEEREAYRRYFEIGPLMARIIETGGVASTTFTVHYRGERRIFAITTTLIDDPDGNGGESEFLFLCAQDITSIRQVEETNRALLFDSQYDKLTGLLNRATTEQVIHRYLLHSPPDLRNTFLILDIDRFKNINDAHGHATGDEVLRYLGVSMRDVFRSNDVLCRWGGDEFVVFVRGFADESVLKNRLDILREKMKSFRYKTLSLKITLSVGGVCATNRASLAALYEKADEALYDVKKRGRNGVAFKSLS